MEEAEEKEELLNLIPAIKRNLSVAVLQHKPLCQDEESIMEIDYQLGRKENKSKIQYRRELTIMQDREEEEQESRPESPLQKQVK